MRGWKNDYDDVSREKIQKYTQIPTAMSSSDIGDNTNPDLVQGIRSDASRPL